MSFGISRCTTMQRSPCSKSRRYVASRSLLRRSMAFCCQGKAKGCIPALYLRAWMQRGLFAWGCFVQRHAGEVMFVVLLVLCLCCIGLKNVFIETNIENLWVESEFSHPPF